MANYMPKDVFEVATCTIAKLHLTKGIPLKELAEKIWTSYSRNVIDDGVVEDLVHAASEGIEWLKAEKAPAIPEFYHHLQYFCMNFDDEGNPKKKMLFDGLWFQKSVQDPKRVENYLRKLKVYYAGVLAGIMPLAPDGWNL